MPIGACAAMQDKGPCRAMRCAFQQSTANVLHGCVRFDALRQASSVRVVLNGETQTTCHVQRVHPPALHMFRCTCQTSVQVLSHTTGHTCHVQVVATLGPAAVALASHTQQPAQRLLVDEYALDSSTSSYTLHSAAVELTTYLHNKGLRIALVPDVKSAATAATAFWAAVASGRQPDEALECVHLPNSVAVAMGLRSAQSSNSVLMVAPTAFGFNEEAAQDNSFMHAAEKPQKDSFLTEEVRLQWGP